jgi:hypothetical protein
MVRRLLPSHRDYVAWTNHPIRLYIIGRDYSDRGATAIAVRNVVTALCHCALESPYSRQ